jgi:ABC-type polysaccharide/polyol phosphate export permease
MSADKHEAVIDGTQRVSLPASCAELWRYREVLYSFTMRTLRVKYKQALFGVAWAVLQPLAFLLIFVFVFSRGAGISGGGGAPYPAFALAALVGWQFVSSSLGQGSQSLLRDGMLLRKVYFPREAPPIGAVGAAFVDLAVAFVLFLLIGPFIGAELSLATAWFPLAVLALVVPTLAGALILSALNVYYRDVRHALPFLIQFLLFASPIAYPVAELPARWQNLYALLNPLVGPLEAFRRTLAEGVAPDWQLLGLSMATGGVLLYLGLRLFKALEPEFADVI